MRVAIVDDEALARRRIRRLLRAEPDIVSVQECSGGQQAIDVLKTEPVDLVFLDVQMPRVTGFDVIDAVGPDRMPHVVFVTAYDAYALRAFDVFAIDYLLKPITAERLQRALTRAREFMARKEQGGDAHLRAVLEQVLARGNSTHATADSAGQKYVQRFMVPISGRNVIVRAGDVHWIRADGNYVRLIVDEGRSYLVRDTLSSLEERLDPAKFARIHRSVIVNVDRIRELKPAFAGDWVVILHSGVRLKLTRTHREQLIERLNL